MKLISIHIFRWVDCAPVLLCYDINLEGKSFFAKQTAKEFLTFNARLVSGRTLPSVRASIALEDELMCYCWTAIDKLSATAICDKEYPSGAAFWMLNKLMLAFRE